MAYGVSEAKATRIGGIEKIYPLSTDSLVLFTTGWRRRQTLFFTACSREAVDGSVFVSIIV